MRFVDDYRGEIRAATGGCTIPLIVSISGAADVSLVGTGDKTLKLQAFNCRNFTCGLDDDLDLFSRSIARQDKFTAQVDNGSQSSARITGVQVGLSRGPGGEGVKGELVKSTKQEFELDPQSVSDLVPIEISRDNRSGHYTRAIYLTVLGADKRVALPLELDVKVGPLYAILALLLALFVQFLIWFAGRSKARTEELREIRALRKKMQALLREDRDLLEGRLNGPAILLWKTASTLPKRFERR